jgi:hypothetical protein
MIGILFNTAVAVFAVATIRLKEATGEVLPQHDFPTLRRMTNLARDAAKAPATSAARRRAKRARERTTRTSPRTAGQTGEWKRSDIHRSQSPDDIHRTHVPNRESLPEETLK